MNRFDTQTRRFAAKASAGALALAGSATAMAQDAGSTGAQILAKVNEGLGTGEQIAVAVVLGFFAIWAIKLLWRSK
ncbi:MAG: hypothetical protein QM569_15295 [Acidovorax sp.]|uniref:hypothetical protein n=1 Tax=Acidovorax sp. TaxID=1872122 RepID=UPI0039E53F9D